MIHNRLCRYGR